jgi:hypothetical protein
MMAVRFAPTLSSPQHVEQARGDVVPGEALGLPRAREDEAAVLDRGHGLEDLVTVAPVAEIPPGDRDLPIVPVPLVDRDQALGLQVGKRADQHRVHDAEDGGVAADAERESDHSHGREAGAADEHARAVPEIAEQRFHGRSPPELRPGRTAKVTGV